MIIILMIIIIDIIIIYDYDENNDIDGFIDIVVNNNELNKYMHLMRLK